MNKAYGELELVFPTEEYKEQIEEYLQEHFDNNEHELSGAGGLDRIKDVDKWLEKIRNDISEESIEKGRIPATLFLGIRKSDNKVVGTIQIRHYLNEFLLREAGHIGDGVRPSERRKGYATEMIRLALEECKKIGINRVLMTCDKNNTGSSKSIQKNGGVLENEILLESGEICQRYWISLKKRYADGAKKYKHVLEVELKQQSINEKNFVGDVYLKNFIKVTEPYLVPKGLKIQDVGYKHVEFYDYNSKVKLTAVYDEKDEIVEWYFDIARCIGKEDGVPYEDDLYLDVVLTPSGETILLDEDELKEAYERMEMTKEEFDEAYELANDLIKRIQGNEKKVKEFTDKYLKKLMEQ